jgi:hypothetical protein
MDKSTNETQNSKLQKVSFPIQSGIQGWNLDPRYFVPGVTFRF